MRKTIEILADDGIWEVKVTTRKWLAVNRVEGDYWAVTHLASKRQLPGYFFSKKDAIAAAKIARSRFPHPLRQRNQAKMPTLNGWFQDLETAQVKFVR